MVFSRLKQLVKLPLAVGVMLAAQGGIAGTLTGVSVTPADNSANQPSNYTFNYTLAQDVGADEALFYVTFPGDFVVDGSGTACDKLVSLTLTPSPGAAICRAAYGSGNTIGFAVNTMIGGGVDVPANTVVEVVISGITNPSAGGNYNFDSGSSTALMTTMPIDSMMPGLVTPKDTAPQQTVTIAGGGSVVNGLCGASHGDLFTSAPSGSLCATGTASAVTAMSSSYDWTCTGSGGGTDATCSANKGYDLILSISPPSSGSIGCTSNPVIHGGNTTCTPTAGPGYTFNAWSNDCVGASCVLNNVTSSLNPQANFTLNQYAITTAVNPAPAGTATCTTNPVDHGSNTSCSYTTNAGYTFANWSGDCTGATCNLTGVTGAKSVTANFNLTPATYTITVNTSGSGTASCSPNPVNSGSNATCTASASTGNSFTGWTGDCTGGSCTLTAVAANKTVTANFAVNTYTISGSAAPAAGGSVSCSGSVSHGSSGSCTATANAGYKFTGWTGCPSSIENSCSFTNVTANQSVTANFTVGSYTVIPFAEPENAGVVECTSPVNYGSTGTCTATANAGYRVKEWFWPDCTGASCSFTINAETQIVSIAGRAYFELIPTFSVSTSVSPADSGRISCNSAILGEAGAICTAVANTGYRFKGWGGGCEGSELACTVLNNGGPVSVSATFEQGQSFTISASSQQIDGSTRALKPAGNAVFEDYISCSQDNPIFQGTTVTCSAHMLKSGFKAWGGGCSRVEGDKCVIENMTSDKHLVVYAGYLLKNDVVITPAGAGSVWCSKSSSDLFSINISTLQESCKAEANQGYKFVSYSAPICADGFCSGAEKINVNFEKVANTPAVICTNCNQSTTETFGASTKTATQTTTPDAQGNSTQTNVATTTNLQSGGITTSVNVNTQSSAGTVQLGGSVSTNDPNAQVVVNVGSTSLQTSNLTTGTTSTAVVTTAGTTVNTVSIGAEVGTTQAASGLLVGIGQNTQGTSLTVTSSLTGTNLGTTSISGNAISTTSGNGSSLVRSTSQDNSTPTTTSYGASSITTMTTIGRSVITTVQTTGASVVAPTVSIASTQTASLISGAISGGFTSVGSGGFTPSGGSGGLGGGFGGGNFSVQVSAAGTFNPGNKPGLRKTAAEDDNAQAAIDITGGSLQSVQLYSDSIGLVEFFKPGSAAGSPQMTAFESTDESFSITLSYPAAN